MLQEAFRIPFLNIPVYGYGLMLVVAFLVCVQVAKVMARRRGMDPEVFVNAALIALVTGVIGARLSHVIENWSTYTDPHRTFGENLFDAINIRSGGLTFYGGFLLATPCCIAYAVWSRLPVLRAMDIVAPVVMIGLGFGRIGCYLNGCCYGEICRPEYGRSLTQFPYYSNAYVEQFQKGIIRPPRELLKGLPAGGYVLKSPADIRGNQRLEALAAGQKAMPVQPTQLYSSFTAFLLMALLIAYWTLPHLDGRVFALMLMLEGPARFILEMIRVEPSVYTHRFGSVLVDMSLSMVLGLGVFVAGVVMWVAIGWMHRGDPGISLNRAPAVA